MHHHGVQTASSMSQDTITSRAPLPTKTDQRTLFYASRKQGHSVLASSRIAGISRATGTRWEKASASSQAELSARRALVATKQDIAKELTRIGLYDPEVAPRDKVNALLGASKMLGYDAAIRTEQVIVHANVQQWIDAQRLSAQRIGGEQRALDGRVDPPIDAAAEALSPPQIISKDPETGGK